MLRECGSLTHTARHADELWVCIRVLMMKKNLLATYRCFLVSVVLLSATFASAATIAPPKKTHTKSHHVTESAATQKKMARMKHSSRTTASTNQSSHVVVATARKPLYKRTKYYERFYASS